MSLRVNACSQSFAFQLTVFGELSVAWPGAQSHPWNRFHVPLPAVLQSSLLLQRVYQRFRRIVMTLRSHSKGSLARYRYKVEHARTLQGPLGQKLLEQLLADGILRATGKFYFWQPEPASRHVATTWQELRRGAASQKLLAYLQQFAAKYPKLLDT